MNSSFPPFISHPHVRASPTPAPIVSPLASPVPARARRSILIVDDHPLFRHGIVTLIAAEPDLSVCAEADTAASGLDAMRRFTPDAALLDISLPGTNGLELLKLMRAEQPKLPIVMLSFFEESVYALRALKAGANGYVMKREPAGTFIAALRKVLESGVYVSDRFAGWLVSDAIRSETSDVIVPLEILSTREDQVLRRLGDGRGTREIADELHLSESTISAHRANIKEKLGFRDTKELVDFAAGWVA